MVWYTGNDLTTYNQGDKFVPMERFTLPYERSTAPVEEEEETITQSYGIPNTNAFTNSASSGRATSFNPYTAQPSGSYVTNRTNYGNTGYIQGTEPEEDYAQKIGGMIKTGIGMAIPGGNALMGMLGNMDTFSGLSANDKAFIEMQKANPEQSVFGGNLPNQDRYGYNKVSAWGNYGELVAKNAAKAKNKKPEDRTDFDKYFMEKAKEQANIDDQIAFNNWANQRYIANQIRAGAFKNPDGTDIYSGTNIHGGDGAATTKAPPTPTSIGVSLHGGDSGSNIPDRDRGRSRDKGETGQIAGGHHFRYGGLASIL